MTFSPFDRLLPLLLLLSFPLEAQRGGPPRRLSNPQDITLEGGARVEFREFASRAAGGRGRYSVYLPPAYERRPQQHFPVVYFLHGMFNDHTSWVVERYGNLPRRVEALMLEGRIPQFLIVSPDGQNSFYTNRLDGTVQMEDFITGDLIQEVESRYRALPGRDTRALGGTSMGGYGALKIAMKHARLYRSVAAGSPIIFLGEDPSRLMVQSTSRMARFFTRLLQPVFGIPFDHDHWLANSVEELAARGDLQGLHIFFAYGTADRYLRAFPLDKGIERVDQILSRRGIEHSFKVWQGGPHGWALIGQHLEEFLGFLSESFPKTAESGR